MTTTTTATHPDHGTVELVSALRDRAGILVTYRKADGTTSNRDLASWPGLVLPGDMDPNYDDTQCRHIGRFGVRCAWDRTPGTNTCPSHF
jgi:hypothetical protein